MKNIKIVTLAAGMGLRLKDFDEKQNLPKPLLNTLGKSIIEWSISSYHSFFVKGIIKQKDMYFVILKEHEKQYSISKQLKIIFGNKIKFVTIDKLTRGPAETALIAAKKLNLNSPVIFNDCDHYFSGNSLFNFLINEKNKDFDCLLNVADTNSKIPEWSYVEENKNGEIVDIKEKDKKLAESGAKGIVASYFFRKNSFFIKEAQKMIRDNDMVGSNKSKEFYISQVYSRLLKKKFKIKKILTNKAYPLGNPIQIKNFINNYSPSKFYPEASTVIFDIDGVLVHHDPGFMGKKLKYEYPLKPILNNINYLNSQKDKGNYIVLMTSRPESEKKRLILNLKKLNIKFHKLVMGVSGGTRILINDKKPSIPELKTALAYETSRNKNFKF